MRNSGSGNFGDGYFVVYQKDAAFNAASLFNPLGGRAAGTLVGYTNFTDCCLFLVGIKFLDSSMAVASGKFIGSGRDGRRSAGNTFIGDYRRKNSSTYPFINRSSI